MFNGVRFLKQFLEHEPGVVLDCEFLGAEIKWRRFWHGQKRVDQRGGSGKF